MTAATLTVADALRDARARICQGWCQGHLAEDRNGREVVPNADDAVRWCLLGAIDTNEAEEMIRALLHHRGIDWGVSRWNDAMEREQEDVLALFDEAIAMAEAA